jgi:exodeoxyribonuclease V alpha subunit
MAMAYILTGLKGMSLKNLTGFFLKDSNMMINTQLNSDNILLKLKELAHKGIIRYTDYYFSNFIKNYFYNGREVNDETLILACFLSSETAKGHVCLDINKLTEHPLNPDIEINLPAIHVIKDIIQKNNKVFGNPDALYETPIIFDNDRLYFGRYLYFEKELAFQIKNRLNSKLLTFDNEKLKIFLAQLFPSCKYSPDWQKIAVLLAVLNNFSVISGGPGTGKTRTVASLLALLKRISFDDNRNIKIALAAPTGKAAARLSESIKTECERLKKYFKDKDDVSWGNIIEDIPKDALTIHRLLKNNHSSSVFRHNKENLLNVDVLVIDEVSMVDLSLMTRLITALPHDSKLIFLGDKDQLSSVETGSVLGDICSEWENFDYSDEMRRKIEILTGEVLRDYTHNKNTCQIRNAITILRNNYRFDETSGIGSLSKAINTGKPEQIMDILLSNKFNDISWEEVDAKSIGERLKQDFIKKFEPYLMENDPKKAIKLFIISEFYALSKKVFTVLDILIILLRKFSMKQV